MTGSSALTSSQTSVAKYTKILPVTVRNDNAGLFQSNNAENVPPNEGMLQSTRGEQRELVRVTLIYPSGSYGSMHSHKEIILRLTNDDNPLFYYHLRVTEAEFPNLRLQQGLLVDFNGFPGQLVSLLDKCDPNTSRGKDDSMDGLMRQNIYEGSGPRFVLVMKINGGNTGNTSISVRMGGLGVRVEIIAVRFF